MKAYKQNYQSGKQCICSHKYSKQTSSVAAGSLFLLVGGSYPNPLFAEFHSAATHRSSAFLSRPSAGFLKNREIGTPAKSQTPASPRQNFLKGVDKNIRLCYHNNELNTAHIFQLEELDRPTLLRLVKRIEVGEKYEIAGETHRDIKIYYNFVEYVEL